MMQLTNIAIVVEDYDEAIHFYTKQLGFRLIEDTPLEAGKRWVRVAPENGNGCALLLAKAVNEQQQSRIGNQTGGRVFLFLATDDFGRDYKRMLANDVRFLEKPRHEIYGTVAVFEDLYGNKWDLIEQTRKE